MNTYTPLLKKAGLSVTEPRLLILFTLDTLNKPVTIEELSKALNQEIHHTTLYRSLKIFVEKGIVYQADFHDGVAYFEYHGDDHHHHVTCTSCKKKKALYLCIESLIPNIEATTSYTVANHTLEFFGTCERCSSKNT